MADLPYTAAAKINSPDCQSVAYASQVADLTIVQDCYEGTSAITAKREVYLRKFGAETKEDFDVRVKSSKFWNAFRRSVHGLVGLIFRKNPVIAEDVPSVLKTQFEDIDLQGTHLDVFAKERGLRGLIDGHTFILVDMPPSVLLENPQATLADERTSKRRPYWVPVNKAQVVNWRCKKDSAGVDNLVQVSIRESVMVPNGEFGEKQIDQYRVLQPGSWKIYRKIENTDQWTVYQEGVTSLDYIPLVPFYALQTGYFKSTPPLLDVAHENIRHYNLQSSLDRILDLCNVPTPVIKGRDDPMAPLVVGAGVIDVPIDGDAKFLEPTGAAIKSTQEEIDRAKMNIASLGLLLLSSQPKVTKTATETTVEYTAETAELSAIARNLQDAIERALTIHADYLGIERGGSVKVNKDFVKLGIDPQSWQRLQDDIAAGRLTLETYWKILEGAEILPEDFDAKTEKAELDAMVTPEKLNVERGQLAIERDKQMMTGNPEAITRRILAERMNLGGPPS